MFRTVFIAIILTVLVMAGCRWFDPDEFEVQPGVLELVVVESAVPADGASVARLFARIDPKSAERTVKFTASTGSFVGGDEVEANADGWAINLLKSTNVETSSVVQASMKGIGHGGVIKFERAYPSRIVVDLSAFTIQAGLTNEVTVTAQLTRELGIPTVDTPVTFDADVGDFRAVTASDATGKATAVFTAGATPNTGPVTISATVDADGTMIRGEATITVTP